MTNKRFGFMAALLAVGALNVAAFGEEPAKGQPAPAAGAQGLVGKPAPDFTGIDVEGKEIKLSDHKGKIVVVEWFSSKCPFCKIHLKEKKTMQNTLAKFAGKDVAWIAVDSNVAEIAKPDEIKSFAKEVGVSYPIIIDADGRIGHSFGAKTTPHMFVIDKTGIIAYEGAIDSDPTGKEASATNYVEAALQSLVDGSEVATKYTKSYGCSVKYAPTGDKKEEKKDKAPGAGSGH